MSVLWAILLVVMLAAGWVLNLFGLPGSRASSWPACYCKGCKLVYQQAAVCHQSSCQIKENGQRN